MLELEIQKLTAAITALTTAIQSGNKVCNEGVRCSVQTEPELKADEVPAIPEKPVNKKAGVKAATKAAPAATPTTYDPPDSPPSIKSEVTAEDLKTVALEISRADSNARVHIVAILGKHGAKTITQLDPKHYREVHAALTSVVYDIAKNGEAS